MDKALLNSRRAFQLNAAEIGFFLKIKKLKQFSDSTSRRDFWFHREFLQTLPGKTFPLWDKSCELKALCPITGARGTAPVLPTLSPLPPRCGQPPASPVQP